MANTPFELMRKTVKKETSDKSQANLDIRTF